MKNLENIFTNFIETLKSKKIIEKDISGNSLYQKAENLKGVLKEKFSETKIPRMMKSVHYANRFQNEDLKNFAFVLDEIEQYLCLNNWMNHDNNVDYFNEKITQENFEINPISMVTNAVESLLINLKK